MPLQYFTKVTVHFSQEIDDEAGALFWSLSPDGVELQEKVAILYFENPDENLEENLNEVFTALTEQYAIAVVSHTVEVLENKNWNEEWEKSLTLIRISDRVVIHPDFIEYTPSTDEVELIITPKMSFGTGEHQTTKLMVRAIERNTKTGMRVLDVGSGTGVLAIAALKFGATYAVAVDNDEWCLENAVENGQLNACGDSLKILIGTVDDVPERDFDIVVANIQKNVLMEIAPNLLAKVKQGGILLLSGLLRQDEEDIKKQYQSAGAEFWELTTLDEWIGMMFKKK